MDLRRRARRRLVGAAALALVAVVLLPMIFDPEPKPLGSDVDIRIPDPGTPFLPPAQPASGEPPAMMPPAPPAADTAADEAPPPTLSPTPEASAKPAPESRPKPVQTPAKAAPGKPEPKASAQAEPEKPLKPPSGPFAAEGYFLQLGAFSSERNARQLLDKVAAAGFKASIYAANSQWRVRVGPYEDRRDALDMQRKLKSSGFSTVLLGP